MSAVVFARHAMTPAERLRDAGWVAFVGLILGIPLVGLTTVDVGGRLGVETRFGLLAAASPRCSPAACCCAGRSTRRATQAGPRPRQHRHRRRPRPRRAARGQRARLGRARRLDRAADRVLRQPLRRRHRHHGADLRDAGLGAERRRRPRRPARPRLRRLLRGRRLLPTRCWRPSSAGASGRRCRCRARWPRSSASCSAFPVLRLRGDYLAIVTLGFGEIIRIILVNWTEFSNGPNGISSIPAPELLRPAVHPQRAEGSQTFAGFFGHRILADAPHDLPLLPDPGAGAAHQPSRSRLRKLPVGRAWEALREDEIACQAMGINTTNTKLSAFAIGAMFGGFAGVLLRRAPGLHQPGELHLHRVGDHPRHRRARRHGLADRRGAGGRRCWSDPRVRRNFAEYRMLAFGLAMVLIMVWRPGGLLSHREPTVRLNRSASCATKEAAR
jgi:branched-chain amino acid transport system permease protein